MNVTKEKIKKLTDTGIAMDNISLKTGDASELPYADKSFDAVYIAFTLELFDTPEIPTVLSEIRRVLKDGGRLLVTSLAKRNYEDSLGTKVFEWVHEKLEFIANCRPIYVQNIVGSAGFTVTGINYVETFGIAMDVILAKK